MLIEKKNGVHMKEMAQADRKKSTAEQFAELHKLNNHPFVETDKTEDLGSRTEVKVLE